MAHTNGNDSKNRAGRRRVDDAIEKISIGTHSHTARSNSEDGDEDAGLRRWY